MFQNIWAVMRIFHTKSRTNEKRLNFRLNDLEDILF